MNVLFVCSGNGGVSPIILAQAESIRNVGANLEIFSIIGKGVWGYLSSIPKLVREIRIRRPDVIHAHYSFCGFVAALSSRTPIVVSLMGSDVLCSSFWNLVIHVFVKHIWDITIVKSEDMLYRLNLRIGSVHVVPNGVDINRFKPMDKIQCRQKIGWDCKKNIILFAADPSRPEKNFKLAQETFEKIEGSELKVVHGVAQSEMLYYMNASDALLLTSLWEGSPNVVKEAMACNLPIIATDVGDVKWLFGNTEGCHVVDSNATAMSHRLTNLFDVKEASSGRKRIMDLKLDSDTIAQTIIRLYAKIARKYAG